MDAPQRKRRFNETKTLVTVAIILLLIIAILFITLVVLRSKQGSESAVSSDKYSTGSIGPKLCVTQSCITTAAIFLESMNTNVDPCTDFYDHACGRYVANATIPENRVSRQRTDMIEDFLNLAMKSLLEKPKMSSEMSFVQKAKDFYAACMNSTQIDRRHSKPLLDLLKKMGGWPVIIDPSGQQNVNYSWSRSMLRLNLLCLDNDQILTLKVLIDESREPNFIIMISEPVLAIPYVDGPEDAALKHPDIVRYKELITTVAEMLGAQSGFTIKENVTKQIEDIVRFEYRLSQVISESRKNKRRGGKLLTVKQLEKEVPAIRWLPWFRVIFKNMTESHRVVLKMEAKYMLDIFTEINKVKKRVIKNYMIWRAIFSTLHLLSSQYQHVLYNYESMKDGHDRVVMPKRWEVCTKAVNKQFKHGLANMYVKYFLEYNIRNKVAEMFKELTKEMDTLLLNADWLDYKTQTAAIGKIREMKSLIGYPKEILDDDFMHRLYKGIKIVQNDYFQSTLQIEQYWPDYNIANLRMMNKLKWYDEIATDAVGSYSLRKNQIEIPAGIMQKLYLATDRPNYINYAMMGFQIAHHIAHGFDNTGPLFDKGGKVVQWWDPSTAIKFEERTSCLIGQYSTYIAPESNIQVDGVKTLAANIADNVGVKIAYAAYKTWMKKNGKQEEILPYFTYSTEQLFWISYANNLCAKLTPSASKQNMRKDLHSPSRFRVNGVVSNSPDFARDFKCKERTLMNPSFKMAGHLYSKSQMITDLCESIKVLINVSHNSIIVFRWKL